MIKQFKYYASQLIDNNSFPQEFIEILNDFLQQKQFYPMDPAFKKQISLKLALCGSVEINFFGGIIFAQHRGDFKPNSEVFKFCQELLKKNGSPALEVLLSDSLSETIKSEFQRVITQADFLQENAQLLPVFQGLTQAFKYLQIFLKKMNQVTMEPLQPQQKHKLPDHMQTFYREFQINTSYLPKVTKNEVFDQTKLLADLKRLYEKNQAIVERLFDAPINLHEREIVLLRQFEKNFMGLYLVTHFIHLLYKNADGLNVFAQHYALKKPQLGLDQKKDGLDPKFLGIIKMHIATLTSFTRILEDRKTWGIVYLDNYFRQCIPQFIFVADAFAAFLERMPTEQKLRQELLAAKQALNQWPSQLTQHPKQIIQEIERHLKKELGEPLQALQRQTSGSFDVLGTFLHQLSESEVFYPDQKIQNFPKEIIIYFEDIIEKLGQEETKAFKKSQLKYYTCYQQFVELSIKNDLEFTPFITSFGEVNSLKDLHEQLTERLLATIRRPVKKTQAKRVTVSILSEEKEALVEQSEPLEEESEPEEKAERAAVSIEQNDKLLLNVWIRQKKYDLLLEYFTAQSQSTDTLEAFQACIEIAHINLALLSRLPEHIKDWDIKNIQHIEEMHIKTRSILDSAQQIYLQFVGLNIDNPQQDMVSGMETNLSIVGNALAESVDGFKRRINNYYQDAESAYLELDSKQHEEMEKRREKREKYKVLNQNQPVPSQKEIERRQHLAAQKRRKEQELREEKRLAFLHAKRLIDAFEPVEKKLTAALVKEGQKEPQIHKSPKQTTSLLYSALSQKDPTGSATKTSRRLADYVMMEEEGDFEPSASAVLPSPSVAGLMQAHAHATPPARVKNGALEEKQLTPEAKEDLPPFHCFKRQVAPANTVNETVHQFMFELTRAIKARHPKDAVFLVGSYLAHQETQQIIHEYDMATTLSLEELTPHLDALEPTYLRHQMRPDTQCHLENLMRGRFKDLHTTEGLVRLDMNAYPQLKKAAHQDFVNHYAKHTDFTVHAVFYEVDPETGQGHLIDCTGLGLNDLKQKILRLSNPDWKSIIQNEPTILPRMILCSQRNQLKPLKAYETYLLKNGEAILQKHWADPNSRKAIEAYMASRIQSIKSVANKSPSDILNTLGNSLVQLQASSHQEKTASASSGGFFANTPLNSPAVVQQPNAVSQKQPSSNPNDGESAQQVLFERKPSSKKKRGKQLRATIQEKNRVAQTDLSNDTSMLFVS